MGIDNSRWKNISIFDVLDDGKYLWFSAIEYNALFRVDKRNMNIEYVGYFPDEDFFAYRLYTSINEYNGKLFFTPCSAHEIGVYDMKENRFEKINIGISKNDNNTSDIKYGKKFVSGFIAKGKLILIPCCYDREVIYDLTTGIVTTRTELVDYFYTQYKDFTRSPDFQFYLCWFAKKTSELEIVFELHCNLNIIIFYNLETGKFTEKRVGDAERSYSLIECDEKYIFLYDEIVDTIVKYEVPTGICTEYNLARTLPSFRPCGLEHSFVNMVIFGADLYLIPANTNVAVKMDISTGKVSIVSALSEECLVQDEKIAYMTLSRIFDNKLYLFGNRSQKIILYEEENELQHIKIRISPYIDDLIEKNYFLYLLYNHHRFFDETNTSMGAFLKGITDLKNNIYENGDEGIRDYGYRIYECINNLGQVE